MRKAAVLAALILSALVVAAFLFQRRAPVTTLESNGALDGSGQPVVAATATEISLATPVHDHQSEDSHNRPTIPQKADTDVKKLPLDPDAFKAAAAKTAASLPTLQQIKAMSAEEQHKTPLTVIQAGADIGDLADAIEKNPALAPEGLKFYGGCARRGDLSSTVRALCLANQRELAQKTGTPSDEKGVSADILQLADKLKQ